MGNCNFKTENTPEEFSIFDSSFRAISQSNFKYYEIIGKGGFSKVWKVQYRKTKQLVALKMMSKAKIITKKSVHSVMNELHLLQQLHNNFIVNMVFAFQDKSHLYLGMDLLQGGDLRFHICMQRKFTEDQTKFFISCLLLALKYLHQNSVLHRDVKPENLVFDEWGYLYLTDLGIARIWRPENSQDTSGTPGYMAPEVMCRQNHGVGVDYYAVGVIVYELMLGKRPYNGKSRQDIRDQILATQVQIKKSEIPKGWSYESAQFVNQLLERKPSQRLGSNGPQELSEHAWFKDYPWDLVNEKSMIITYIPGSEENYFRKNLVDTQSELDEQNELLLRKDSVQSSLFNGYSHQGNSLNKSHSSSLFSVRTVSPLKTQGNL